MTTDDAPAPDAPAADPPEPEYDAGTVVQAEAPPDDLRVYDDEVIEPSGVFSCVPRAGLCAN